MPYSARRVLTLAACAASLTVGGTRASHAQQAAFDGRFQRFPPGACWAGTVQTTVDEAWQLMTDSASYRQRGIPILRPDLEERTRGGTFVPDSLRVCDAHLASAPGSGLHLLDAARVKLRLNDDAAAAALAQRYLRDVGTATPANPFVADRAWALMLVARMYALATPARWDTAQRIVAEIDGMPKASLGARWRAHFVLAQVANDRHNDADVLREVDALLALWRAHPREVPERLPMDMYEMIKLRNGALLRQRGVATAKAAVDSVYKVLSSTGHSPWGLQALMYIYANVLGKPAAPIQGTWWYRTADSGRTIRPVRGKVTLVFSLAAERFEWQWYYEKARVLRALLAKYGAQGLEVVAVDETMGWFLDSVYTDPLAEAGRRRRAYLEDHGLPGIYTIYHNTDWRQLPDGRWFNKPSPRDRQYPFSLTLVDKQGIAVYGVSYGTYEFPEAYLDTKIAELLRQ